MQTEGPAALLLGVLVSLFSAGAAIYGNYITSSQLMNQVLHQSLRIREITNMKSVKACEDICQEDPTCDSFSFSGFQQVCEIYKMKAGSRSISKNKFNLYVREKTTSEGFEKFGTDYIKFVDKMMDAYEAQDHCKAMGGELLTIVNEAMNEMAREILSNKVCFEAFIGMTDQKKEGDWKKFDGGAANYRNFDWNGVWDRTDKNCVIMKIIGKWRHVNCFNKYYSFCRIPMF